MASSAAGGGSPHYQRVGFFHAEQATDLLAQFHELGQVLDAGEGDPVAAVHAALAAHPGRWLLVLDNLRDHAAARRWLPAKGAGHVLVTTQDGHWPAGQAVEVPALDRDAAAGFLLDRSMSADVTSARAVAEELGLLPLALEQAAHTSRPPGGAWRSTWNCCAPIAPQCSRAGPRPRTRSAQRHRIAASTVWQTLHDAGINPASRRAGPTWKQFLTAQARGIIAVDFVRVDTVLLRRVCALIVIEHGTRRAHLAGITAHPDGARTTQAARNLLMDLGQRTSAVKFVIRDRAGQFTGSFDAVFTAMGTRIVASPPHAPTANAICERVVGTRRPELLDRLLVTGEQHLRRVPTEYLTHALPRPARPASSRNLPTRARQPRAPDPPETGPRRTHPRVPRSCLTRPAGAINCFTGFPVKQSGSPPEWLASASGCEFSGSRRFRCRRE
jgi:putative transposase